MQNDSTFQITGTFIGKEEFKTASRIHNLHRLLLKNHEVDYEFLHVQRFADWCQKQIGFGNMDEDGKAWVLNKDLLGFHDKTWGPENCVFIPLKLNSLIAHSRQVKKSNLPSGVGAYSKKDGKVIYSFNCTVDGARTYVSGYGTAEEASAAHVSYKTERIRLKALELEYAIDPRTFRALMAFKVK